jgi:hypothetical protein
MAILAPRLKSASLKRKLALAYIIIAIPGSSKARWGAKRRNDGKAKWRSVRQHIGSEFGIACRSRRLKYCISTIGWYCTSDVYFCTTWTDPIYYEFTVCNCCFIMPRKRQDAA